MDRRTFCVSSTAVAAAFAADLAFSPSIAANGPATGALYGTGALYKVIFDTRFAASRAFAATAARAGRRTAAIQGDVTALWFDDLRLRWAAPGGAIAGMTTVPSLFCLEQLAKDHWLRVIARAVPPADPRLVSWVIGVEP